MQYFLDVLLVLTAFVSFIPVISMFKNKDDRKYKCLKFLIYFSFIWSILILISRVVSNTWIIYYSSMLSYPLKMTFSVLLLCTAYNYAEKKFPNILKVILSIFVAFDLGIALTNSVTQYFIKVNVNDLMTYKDFFTADHGSLFIYHLIASYVFSIAAVVLLLVFLKKRESIRRFRAISSTLIIGIMIVLLANFLELTAIKVNVDLTYISMIFAELILFRIIYSKDIFFYLKATGRAEILSNMREMYILTDRDKRIIEVSPTLIEKYNLKIDEFFGKKLDSLVKKISDRVVLYDEMEINDPEGDNLDHYHLREKVFHLKGIQDFGYMILLYDETEVYKLLIELNRLSNFDTMTGLNNRNYMEYKLDNMPDLKDVGVISMDLNGLKINNDYLGHERGDELLKGLANNLKIVFKNIGNKDMARIGGDEFLIILYDGNKDILEKKKQELLKLCTNKDIEKNISLSIGISLSNSETKSIFQLIKEADENMYKMKFEQSPIYKKALIKYIKLQDKFIR